MKDIHMIPVGGKDASIPPHTYAVRLSDLASYGDSVTDAIRAFADEHKAKAYAPVENYDGLYAIIVFPSNPK